MSESRKKAAWPAVTALVSALLVLAALGAYVAVYFATSTLHETDPPIEYFRLFQRPWQASIYAPLALVESKIRGCKVSTATWGEEDSSI